MILSIVSSLSSSFTKHIMRVKELFSGNIQVDIMCKLVLKLYSQYS